MASTSTSTKRKIKANSLQSERPRENDKGQTERKANEQKTESNSENEQNQKRFLWHNNTDKNLARSGKKMTNIRNNSGNITVGSTEVKGDVMDNL